MAKVKADLNILAVQRAAKAYEDHEPLQYGRATDLRQQGAATAHEIMREDMGYGWLSDACRTQDISRLCYARARFDAGLRASDYDWECK